MSIDPTIMAALVAGVVSMLGAVVSYRSNAAATFRQVQQAQFSGVIAKRIEIYPALWQIIIRYEANWTLEGKPKTKEWAKEYVSALNYFNQSGGLFFSQALYEKFSDLRSELYAAIQGGLSETYPSGLSWISIELLLKLRFRRSAPKRQRLPGSI
jgi:hypothetical protein